MQTEERIKEELKKQIEYRKIIFNNPAEKKISNAIIETLEWVLKTDKKKELITTPTNAND